jgi:flavin-binding protein dodecin
MSRLRPRRESARVVPPDRGGEARRTEMSVARVTEITSSSEKSFEDALQAGVARAAKTLKNVEGAWVQEQKVVIDGGRITEYRVNMKVTFVLED